VRRPSGDVLEQPDRADPPLGAEIEPVMGTARHADQIARLDFDGKHRLAGDVDVKQAASFDDEANFVLVVPMLTIELCEHDV
jgi:hypothetical protein